MNSAPMIRLNPNNPSVVFFLVRVTCLQTKTNRPRPPDNQLRTKQAKSSESTKKGKRNQTHSTTDCQRLRGRDSSPPAPPATSWVPDHGRRLVEEGGAIEEDYGKATGA